MIDKPGHKHLSKFLIRRLQRTLPGVVDRLMILPTAPTHGKYNLRRHFLELIAASDVMIDSFPIGGGTTSIEAFSTDIPIVTLPGPTLPGRFTEFMLRLLGVSELIADSLESYVEIATRLGKDAAWQRAVRAKIRQNKHRLYKDAGAVREWENFLLRAPHGGLEESSTFL